MPNDDRLLRLLSPHQSVWETTPTPAPPVPWWRRWWRKITGRGG
jgi:hypothetical protein